MTATMRAPLRRGLAFLAGVGFAAVPSVGPFIALAVMAVGRIGLQRADRWWWLATALLSLPLALTGHPVAALATAIQLLATWLIFRSATEIRHSISRSNVTNDVGTGLVVGLFVTLLLGLRQVEGFRWDTALTFLDSVTWKVHPATFSHAILVLAALLAIVVPSARLRVVALALGAVGVVLTGAREAIFAWLLIALGLRFVGRRGSRMTTAAEWTLIGLVLLIGMGALNVVGLGRTGFLTAFDPDTVGANLLRGTEVAVGDWWYPLGVEVVDTNVTIQGVTRTGYTVTKVWAEPWSRLQQVVTLQPNQTYTLSSAWRVDSDATAGFDGWGKQSADAETVLSTYLTEGSHVARASGDITVLSSSATSLGNDWVRGQVTLRYGGERPLVWYVGVVPDRSNLTGVSTTFAELQLTPTDALVPYVPGHSERGVSSLAESRLPIWRDALGAIAARPLLGWGPNGLPAAIETLLPQEARLRPIAAHAHSMLLAIWVDRGLVGVLGLVVLGAVMSLRAIQQRDRAAAIVLIGVAILNAFDATFLSGAVIYPLAAILGWRAVGHRKVVAAETGIGSATAVRLALAASDVAAGAISISLGIVVSARLDPALSLANAWTPYLAYTTLLWPLVAGWSGQYPGYGRTAHDELKGIVSSAAGAALLLAVVVMILPGIFALTTSAIFVTILGSVVLAPTFRAIAKLMLRGLHLWGRPVVVLGTGVVAERTTAHLLSHPGVGLHPIAAFGHAETWDVDQLPISGPLEHAWRFVHDHNVRHAIVTAEAAKVLGFDEVLRRADRQLRYVQYLPDLSGLPTSSVIATPLGATLALEVRNQLASKSNGAWKRAMDLSAALVLLTVLGVPLLLIALLIRLDSKGPVLYFSPRVGRYGKTFRCVKFRTMFIDAEKRLSTIMATDPDARREYREYRKLSNDPRVTRIGAVLRRLSLDEFPQLINVVTGNMSLVGPRPYMVTELSDMGPDRDLIFLARPGMTGYWQVEARNDVDFVERQTMEAHYVRNWSVWWDISILLATPLAMLGPDGK